MVYLKKKTVFVTSLEITMCTETVLLVCLVFALVVLTKNQIMLSYLWQDIVTTVTLFISSSSHIHIKRSVIYWCIIVQERVSDLLNSVQSFVEHQSFCQCNGTTLAYRHTLETTEQRNKLLRKPPCHTPRIYHREVEETCPKKLINKTIFYEQHIVTLVSKMNRNGAMK